MKDVKVKKCGCTVFEVGPPVLCDKHQHKADKKEKREARKAARDLKREEKGLRKIVSDAALENGHDLTRFKEYGSSPGKWTAHCHGCGAMAIVYDRIPAFGDQVNAKKLFEPCEKSALVGTLGAADREAIAARFRSDDEDSDDDSGGDAEALREPNEGEDQDDSETDAGGL